VSRLDLAVAAPLAVTVTGCVPARQDAQRADHYGLLRTIEENFGLAPLGSAAAARPLL
jgi:hypothetical protein